MNIMYSPFDNDMFALVWSAYCKVFPDKIPVHCECYWVSELKDDDGNEVFGSTATTDDGGFEICISGNIKVADSVEVFAHELAHIAAGVDSEHNEEWENAFDLIHRKYCELAETTD